MDLGPFFHKTPVFTPFKAITDPEDRFEVRFRAWDNFKPQVLLAVVVFHDNFNDQIHKGLQIVFD
jgi:hypothetical protein